MVMGITPARRDDDFRNELAHLNLPSCERRTWFWTLKESFDLFLNGVITWKLDSEFMGMLRKLLLASSVVPNCSFRYADVWQLRRYFCWEQRSVLVYVRSLGLAEGTWERAEVDRKPVP
jgi:hypothetical protein